MSTKAEITTKINTNLASSSSITATEHREVLHTDPDSLLEAIYATSIQDYSEGTHAVTTPNSNFTYFANFSKVGKLITVTGTFTSQNLTLPNETIFTIDNTDFSCLAERFYCVASGSGGFYARVYMTGTTLKIFNALSSGTTLYYTITYSALN